VSEADTELGELPEGWLWRRVGEVCEIWGGMTPSTSDARYWDGEVPWVSSKDIKGGRVLESCERITEVALRENRLRLCKPGTLLVVVRSGVLAHSIPTAIVERDLVINQDVKAFWSEIPGFTEWLRLAFQARERDLLDAHRKDGTTVQSLKVDELREMVVSVPPLSERHRILASLGTMLEEENHQRTRLERLRGVVARTRRSVLASAFRGALTSGWRAENPNVADGTMVLERVLSERTGTVINVAATARRPFNRPDPARVDDALGTLPSTWTWAPVEALGELSLGKKRSPEFHSGPLMRPYLRVANIKAGGRIDLSSLLSMNFEAHEEEHFSLRDGDILLSEGQSLELVGQSAIFREGPDGLCFQMTLQRFRRWASAPSSEFMQYVFSHYVMNGVFPRYASMTVNIAHLTLERLKPIPVPLPPVEEQEQIVRLVDHWFAVLDDVERRITRGLALCDRLRESLLQKAIRGELLPPSPAAATP